jgi:hypothetical protein
MKIPKIPYDIVGPVTKRIQEEGPVNEKQFLCDLEKRQPVLHDVISLYMHKANNKEERVRLLSLARTLLVLIEHQLHLEQFNLIFGLDDE